MIEGFVSGLLPNILADFHRRFPAVTFKVQTGSTDRIIEALIADEADIGMTFNATPRAEIETVAEHVEPILCMVASTHEFAGRASLTLDDICGHPLALPEHSFGLRQLFDRTIAERNLKANVFVTTNSLDLTKTMAATGQVIAFMPALTLIPELSAGHLRAIPVTDPGFGAARSGIVVHRDRPLSHAAQEFLKALIAAIQSLSGRAASTGS